MGFGQTAIGALFALAIATVAQAQPPRAVSQTWTIRNFKFHDGSVLPELKLHYLTLGSPANPAVLVLHGTGGSGGGLLSPNFGGQLFGPGQPLDAKRWFIILPDAIGHGASSKPSDGLRMGFPPYDYADMIEAQHRLLNEHLGVKHLAVVTGNSMGGMMTWQWGEQYPDFMDALVPLASTPAQVSARNWITRRMVIDVIKADPGWKGGNYDRQPRNLALASAYFGLITSGGARAQAAAMPTWAATDKAVTDRLAAPAGGDANDRIYQLLAARDYDPAPGLGTIKARVLAINSADDERNPAELGVTARAVKTLRAGRYYEIPASAETRGHGTTGQARFWTAELSKFLAGE
jgi:homoserine O-acetyltransferase